MVASQVGRNDPCPCGSGKRYKACHGGLILSASESHRDQARAQFGAGLHDLAAASARDAIARDPRDVEAWNVLGLALEQSHPQHALAAWQRARTLAPHEAEAHFRIGDFFRRRRELGAAIAAYRAALAIAPNSAVIHNNIGLALQEQGDCDEAEQHYRDALQHQPGMVEALANLGDLCLVTHRIPEAIAWFKEALARNPNVAGLWTKLGFCEHRLAAINDATTSFERALALDPRDPKAMLNLASVRL